MDREQAEKLLGAMIFDDLDEASRAELLAHLQTDDELRERLADLRMAVKLAGDAVNDGPAPVLSDKRLKQLKQLAKTSEPRVRVFPMWRVLGVAAMLAFAFLLRSVVVGNFSGHTDKARVTADKAIAMAEVAERERQDRPAAPSETMGSWSRSRGPTTASDADRWTGPSETDRVAGEKKSAGNGFALGVVDGDGAQLYARADQMPRVTHETASPSAIGNSAAISVDESGRSAQGTLSLGVSRRGRGLEGTSSETSVADGDQVALADSQGVRGGMAGSGGGMGGMMGGMGAGGGYGDGAMGGGMGGFSGGMRGSGRGRGARAGTIETGRLGGGSGEMNADRVQRNRAATSDRYGIQDSGGTSLGAVPKEQLNTNAEQSSLSLGWQAGREQAVQNDASVVREKEGLTRGVPPAAAAQPEVSVTYGWSGQVAPTKSGMPSTPPPASGPATAGDNRVPLLGDQPLVGGLFKAKQDAAKKDNWSEASLEKLRDVAGATVPVPEPDRAVVKGAELSNDMESPSAPAHFKAVPVNPWVMTERDALSTFALDVDTASYAVCRRYISGGSLPPVGAVRMEEFINAFDYAYPQRDDATFAVYADGAPSPFAPAGQDVTLLKVAVKARTVGRDQRRAAHIVFVVDASASMGQPDRLPLVQSALNSLVDKLSESDRVSVITCSRDARLHLEAVSARQRDSIRKTVEAIQPTGPTNLMAGLRLGYEMARRAFVAGQINQVVLCSDGVANVGQTEAQAVLDEVANDRKQGITLTCVGVGYGAYNDAFLEALANHGDGRYVFLDAADGAREMLVGQLAATLQTVAKDARIQVQFDPARVRRYRLIGYENRDIEDKRFRDDTVDAGEVGSGQCSTALYELELTTPSSAGGSGNLGTVFVRYRNTETGQIEEVSRGLAGSIIRRRSVEEDPRFFLAAGAARFAEWLRESEHVRQTNPADVQRLLDQVSAALPLDQQVRDLAALAHKAEGLPRATQP